MISLKFIQDYLCSETVISEIINTGRWSWHGTQIQEYFIDECLEEEFCNTKEKRRILLSYLKDKAYEIYDSLLDESPSKLYRALYLKHGVTPSELTDYGLFWSSDDRTSACVSSESDDVEWLLEIEFDHSKVNWEETFRSRIDYIHGHRENEYQLHEEANVTLVSSFII